MSSLPTSQWSPRSTGWEPPGPEVKSWSPNIVKRLTLEQSRVNFGLRLNCCFDDVVSWTPYLSFFPASTGWEQCAYQFRPPRPTYVGWRGRITQSHTTSDARWRMIRSQSVAQQHQQLILWDWLLIIPTKPNRLFNIVFQIAIRITTLRQISSVTEDKIRDILRSGSSRIWFYEYHLCVALEIITLY